MFDWDAFLIGIVLWDVMGAVVELASCFDAGVVWVGRQSSLIYRVSSGVVRADGGGTVLGR